MKVVSVSTIFPSLEIPAPGIFIKERLLGLPEDIEASVLRLRPWFPGLGLIKPEQRLSYPAQESVQGLSVADRRFSYLPGIQKHRDGDLLARGLDRFLNEFGGSVDLIDAHFAFPTGFGAVKVGKKRGKPVCITLRGTLASYAHDARRTKLKEALLGADRIIAVSASLGKLAEEITGQSLDVRVIGNGIDVDKFVQMDRCVCRQYLGLHEEGPTLLTVGGLVPRKGVHRVLDALPALLKDHPNLKYLVVGGASVEGDFAAEVKSKIINLGLEKVVDLVGAVDHGSLPTYYGAADVFCLSTANEGWANALQESLACGTPVVTTDVGGNREVVGSENHGIVVPFGEPDILRDAIVDALNRDWDHEEISRWGRRRSWRDVGKEVAEVFREIG